MCAGRSARRFCFRRSFSRAVPVVGGPEKGRLSGRRGVPSPCTFVNGALRKVPLPEGGVLSRLQDVTDIIRQNKEAQNAQKCGFQKAPTFRRVASIPVAVADIAAAQGLDILNDPEAMRKFLNDPDNRAFRTTLERV